LVWSSWENGFPDLFALAAFLGWLSFTLVFPQDELVIAAVPGFRVFKTACVGVSVLGDVCNFHRPTRWKVCEDM
jgi:hypothetical protein